MEKAKLYNMAGAIRHGARFIARSLAELLGAMSEMFKLILTNLVDKQVATTEEEK